MSFRSFIHSPLYYFRNKQLKKNAQREILTFPTKYQGSFLNWIKKFTTDMTYGMLASGSCLLTDIVDRLHEDFKKVNSVERLTRHLNIEVPLKALKSYRTTVRKRIPSKPIIH